MDGDMLVEQNNAEQPERVRIPILNGHMLQSGQFQNEEISIVGKCLQSNHNANSSNKVEFEASDGIKFSVAINPQSQFDGYTATYIEIRGMVQDDGSVLQTAYQEWGNEFKMATW
eukprot:CAMPEP_0202687310 /NCGR_PEP_ID=MMETSP1385-20130828/3001_1 /ASSEMBLY_ACC=CAM_ASM_000861 /TAXON_ID=933848 /ORGANISM="Elphidium margaritaceum" /LENGTH=114 /DNA_ID=CAMNT_0049342079 /DNA_START=116 /DNA_END=457 /DNA_ORIENTATION=+